MSYAYTHAVVSAREDIKRQPILCASMCAHASFFCFTKGLAFCYFCNPLSCPECVLPAMPLEFQTRSSDHRYLIIAVETILSPERGDNPKFAMLFDGVFALEQCEAYLRAMDFTDFNPLPPLDAFLQPRKVGLRVLGAHCSHGIIGPPWWHHFKELFGKDFGNLNSQMSIRSISGTISWKEADRTTPMISIMRTRRSCMKSHLASIIRPNFLISGRTHKIRLSFVVDASLCSFEQHEAARSESKQHILLKSHGRGG